MEKKSNWYVNQKKFHFIYKTTCLVTNRYYIGMHSTDDLEDGYIGSGTRLARSVRKYGKEQHRCEIIEFLPDREALRLREREIVNEDKVRDQECMNLIMGGGAFDLTQEQYSARNGKCGKKGGKISIKNLHLPHNRVKATISRQKKSGFTTIGMCGKFHTGETKIKMSKKKLGDKNPSFGTCWIFKDDVSKKIRLDQLEVYLSQEWFRGRKQTIV